METLLSKLTIEHEANVIKVLNEYIQNNCPKNIREEFDSLKTNEKLENMYMRTSTSYNNIHQYFGCKAMEKTYMTQEPLSNTIQDFLNASFTIVYQNYQRTLQQP